MDFFFLNSKRTFVILFLVCLGMMAVALFMEHILMLKPCMLCYMQRGAVILVGLIAGIGFLINSEKLIVYKGFVIGCVIAVLSGIGLSLRQLYLQSLPPKLVPSCAPDIDYLLNTLPFLEVLVMAITGDGNCAEVLWSFMGISIPGWTLIGFVVILIYLVKILLSANEIHSHKQN